MELAVPKWSNIGSMETSSHSVDDHLSNAVDETVSLSPHTYMLQSNKKVFSVDY